MIQSPQLSASIEHLYLAFSHYPYRGTLPANCDCCEALDLSRLSQVPLRLLTASELTDVFFVAGPHSGGPDDFRHYLPRVLELFASDTDNSIPASILADRLRSLGVAAWPSPEKEALQAFFRALPPGGRYGHASAAVLPLLSCAPTTTGA